MTELEQAQKLATSIWSKHWKADMPDWEPPPSLHAVLSSIEAMTGGMSRVRLVCVNCEKTPQNIGWCAACGYNRVYRPEVVTMPEAH